MSKLDFLEKEECSDEYLAYCEEQDSLAKAFKKQDHKDRIAEAIEFLKENGYEVRLTNETSS